MKRVSVLMGYVCLLCYEMCLPDIAIWEQYVWYWLHQRDLWTACNVNYLCVALWAYVVIMFCSLGSDPVYLCFSLALLQALHWTQARWLALQTLVLYTKKPIGIHMHVYMYLCFPLMKFCINSICQKVYGKRFIQTVCDDDQYFDMNKYMGLMWWMHENGY